MTILISDSSLKIIDRLESLIIEGGGVHKIFKATGYYESLKLFNDTSPAVVLLDMNFPGNQSFELLRQMKTTGSESKIIALSIHISDDNIEHSKQLGADYFLDKYNEFEKIPDIIKNIANNDINNETRKNQKKCTNN